MNTQFRKLNVLRKLYKSLEESVGFAERAIDIESESYDPNTKDLEAILNLVQDAAQALEKEISATEPLVAAERRADG